MLYRINTRLEPCQGLAIIMLCLWRVGGGATNGEDRVDPSLLFSYRVPTQVLQSLIKCYT